MDWKPIETAPKDATTILLKREETETDYEIVRLGYWANYSGLSAWASSWQSVEDDKSFGTEFTHWCPIPGRHTEHVRAAAHMGESGRQDGVGGTVADR